MTFWDCYEQITVDLATKLARYISACQLQYRKEHGRNAPFSCRDPLDPRIPPSLGLLQPAWQYHQQYVQLMNSNGVKVLFLGLSPGNNGMGKNGIPFGDPTSVNHFLRIRPQVPQDQKEEPSGSRFWGLIETICGTRERFFENCFVQNACPVLLINKNGKHVNPFDLRIEEIDREIRTLIEKQNKDLCSDALSEVIELLQPMVIVTIGQNAKDVIGWLHARVVEIPHPSPQFSSYPIGKDEEWKKEAYNLLNNNDIVQIMNPKIQKMPYEELVAIHRRSTE